MMMAINAVERGAVGDGSTLNTMVLQAAIDAVAEAGGGRVELPAGRFLTGMLRLRSGVELHLCHGAVLVASADPGDHRPWVSSKVAADHWSHEEEGAWHLLVAEDCVDLALTGSGCLDGNGAAHYDALANEPGWPLARFKDGRRPSSLVQFTRCERVKIRDCRLTNVANWTLHMFDCTDCQIRDISIVNPDNAPNADGIDLTGCHRVSVIGCHIDTCDDAVCLKTMPHSRTCENILVSGCVLRTHCVGLKLGASESYQDMRSIVFADCVITHSHRAIGIYSLRGSTFENISINNITCDTSAALMFTRPIHVDVRSADGQPTTGRVRNLRITGLIAQTNGRCLLTAADGGRISDVVLRDVLLQYPLVDDPNPWAADYGGGQFSKHSPWARTVRAAIVFDGVECLTVSGLRIQWPEPDKQPDPKWTPAAKIANGDHRVFSPCEWQCPSHVPFTAVAMRNSPDANIDLGHLSGWQGGQTLICEE